MRELKELKEIKEIPFSSISEDYPFIQAELNHVGWQI
jgi:hypothetical protein